MQRSIWIEHRRETHSRSSEVRMYMTLPANISWFVALQETVRDNRGSVEHLLHAQSIIHWAWSRDGIYLER